MNKYNLPQPPDSYSKKQAELWLEGLQAGIGWLAPFADGDLTVLFRVEDGTQVTAMLVERGGQALALYFYEPGAAYPVGLYVTVKDDINTTRDFLRQITLEFVQQQYDNYVRNK